MKLLTIFLCFYINVLTVLPTVKAIKMTFAAKCHDTCCGKGAADDGCQKEKCLFNINFNNVTYLVFTTEYQLQKQICKVAKKEKMLYQNHLISNFSASIWQPPESTSIIS